MALAAALGATARAGEAPPENAPSKLVWRARPTAASKPARPIVLETSEAKHGVTFKARPSGTASAASVQPAQPVTRITVGPVSDRNSRARLRDTILKVAAYQDPDMAEPEKDELPSPEPGELPSDLPGDLKSDSDLKSDDLKSDLPPSDMPGDEQPLDSKPEPSFPSDTSPIEPDRSPSDVDPYSGDIAPQESPSGMALPSTSPGDVGCKDNSEQCTRAIRQLQERGIETVVVGLLIEGTEGKDFPCDCKIGRDFQAPKWAGRNFAPTLFTWKATGTCHKPLYFEDVQLERYGHSWNPIVQPIMSGAHFFVSVPLLPYKMGLTPPNECMYTLGYYRPGNCAPYMFEPIPLSVRAALAEAAGATAFAFWFWPPH